MSRADVRRPGGGLRFFIYALLVHGVIVALLVVNINWRSTPKRDATRIVQATVVADDSVKKEIERLKKERARIEAQAAEKARQDEQRRLQQAADDAAKKQRAELDKQKALEEKQKALDTRRKAEAEKKAAEEQQRKAEAQKKRQALEEQQRKEAERKKDAEQRRKQAEDALQEQLAAEEDVRNKEKAAAVAAKQQGEIERYKQIIQQTVERKWSRPMNSTPGLACKVRVRTVAGGTVLGVEIVRSSGNDLFDNSAKAAVQKASPLPVPEDRTIAAEFREFELDFKPGG
jgi:colicin import membrane protein